MIFPVERALLVINRTAGTGEGDAIADKLALLFKQGLEELSQVKVELVNNHAAARACAAGFVCESEAPALVVAGGGGGTLRGVIEGICDSRSSAELPGPQRVRVGALRMGSGNVLAKQFGAPRDPVLGLDSLLMNLKAEQTVPCCVMRCETWTSSGNSEIHHAVTLGGLGQFGHIPSDLARWHTRFPFVHKSAARSFGIERLTNFEYALALLIRSVSCVIFPDRAEMIEIQDQTECLRLLSGIVMNFPIPALPFKPAVTVEDEALLVYLIPLRGRCSPLQQIVAPQKLISHARCIRLEKTQRLEIRFVDQDTVEFFLDEDPVTTYRRLSLSVAGSIAFVPGLDYQPIANRGVSR
jgi:Sphingosine kinase and enzymes related to eukaryotic diacylglycerol kinase